MHEFVYAMLVASGVKMAERAWLNPVAKLLLRVRSAAVEGMMLVLSMTGLQKISL